MIAPQTFNNYPEFGCAAVKCCPDGTKYANGYIQGDVLPAEHVNWFLSEATVGVSTLQLGMDSIEREMQTLLACSGASPQANCYSQIYDAIMYQICGSVTTWAAPKQHASSENTFGLGNADCYGHLKISDTYTSVLSDCTGVAASQKAVACVYGLANGKAAVGSTAGCALGTASAGTATTAARSDHVHPFPMCSYIDAYSANADRGVMVTCAVTEAGQCQPVGPSICCKFTFNPATGVVCAKTFCGNLCGIASTAINATYLDNATASDSSTNSSIAKRTGSGNLYATIFHDSWIAENIALYTSTVMFRSSDGFLRNTSKANFQSWLGLGGAAYCAASAFRASTWTPSCVECAGKDGSGCTFGTAARYTCSTFAAAYNSCINCVRYAQDSINACYAYYLRSCAVTTDSSKTVYRNGSTGCNKGDSPVLIFNAKSNCGVYVMMPGSSSNMFCSGCSYCYIRFING